MYCNEGRPEKVVLSLSDSLYKKRATTTTPPTTLTKLGFRAFCLRIGLAGSAQDTDLVFMRNLGVSRDARHQPKFELDLDQACDALQMAAEHKCVNLQRACFSRIESRPLGATDSSAGPVRRATFTQQPSGSIPAHTGILI